MRSKSEQSIYVYEEASFARESLKLLKPGANNNFVWVPKSIIRLETA